MAAKCSVFSNDANRQQMMEKCIGTRFQERPYGVVWVTENALPKSQKFDWPDAKPRFKRVLLVFEGLPVALDSLKNRRRWAIDTGAMDVLIEFVPAEINEKGSLELLNRRCGKWFDPFPSPEAPRAEDSFPHCPGHEDTGKRPSRPAYYDVREHG